MLRAEPAPTAFTSGKFFSSASPLVTRTLAPCCFARARAGRLQFSGAHVVGGRVGEIPAERYALDNATELVAIDALRNDEAYLARFRLAVSRELIRTERKCEGSEPRIVRRIGETVSARRQQIGQLSWPEPVDFRLRQALRSQTARRQAFRLLPAATTAARFGLEPRGAINARSRSPIFLRTESEFRD